MPLWLSLPLRAVLLCAGVFVSVLPRRAELRLGAVVGRALRRVHPRRVIARENLKRCFPKESENKRDQILSQNFEHYGILALELLHMFSPIPSHYRRYVQKWGRLQGVENWLAAQKKGRGVIFVSSHLGNWEFMVSCGSLHGIPLTMVTKRLQPPWLHQKIEASRRSTGVRGAYEPRTLPAVMRALRAGQAVGFVMDQYAGPPIGIPVQFFGVRVGTLAAVSGLSRRTGAAVVPVYTERRSDGCVVVQIEPEIDLSAEIESDERTTEVLAARVESWVRRNPTQWLWTHRRFKDVVWPSELA